MGSEMCIRDSSRPARPMATQIADTSVGATNASRQFELSDQIVRQLLEAQRSGLRPTLMAQLGLSLAVRMHNDDNDGMDTNTSRPRPKLGLAGPSTKPDPPSSSAHATAADDVSTNRRGVITSTAQSDGHSIDQYSLFGTEPSSSPTTCRYQTPPPAYAPSQSSDDHHDDANKRLKRKAVEKLDHAGAKRSKQDGHRPSNMLFTTGTDSEENDEVR